jgi:hypothetical protein
MLFNSLDFVIFLALVPALMRLGGLRLRKWILPVTVTLRATLSKPDSNPEARNRFDFEGWAN